MLYFHGEKRPMWPHSRTAAAGVGPASNTMGSIPRVTRWAAAARPVGPAPITATGRSVVAVVSGMMSLQVRGRGLSREQPGSGPEGHVEERHEGRDFDERANATGQRLPRGDATGAEGETHGETGGGTRRGHRTGGGPCGLSRAVVVG